MALLKPRARPPKTASKRLTNRLRALWRTGNHNPEPAVSCEGPLRQDPAKEEKLDLEDRCKQSADAVKKQMVQTKSN